MKKIIPTLIMMMLVAASSTAFSGDMNDANKVYSESDNYYNSGRYYTHGNYNTKEGDMIVDAFLVRPLGLVGSAAGFVTWVVSLPFSILGGNGDEAAEVLIKEPVSYTFNRPLGDFEDSYAY